MKTHWTLYLYSLFFCTVTIFTATGSLAQTANMDHQSLHDVYLANTEHELHVFRIYGKKPGKTLMLIGGIQGDEPGGYLTADLYADISLQQGNLIVVPRANFYSILLNQRNGLTGDMNRKFGEMTEQEKNLEQEIVTILKQLIAESDCLLNLHEGSGFYHSEWVNETENPDRYGQSIIYDAATYPVEETGEVLELEQLAQRVMNRVNPQIENSRYHFRTNNHNTVSDETRHKEQRKSATYYALTRAHIPAFGIETSKSITENSVKVNLQKQVVNGFMAEFGIIPETPGQHIEETELDYVLVKINGGLPYAVPNGSRIEVNNGDEVIITDIIANFERGLAADFLDMGSYNDTKLPFRIAGPTKVVIRKDAETCGFVEIAVKATDKTIATTTSDGKTSLPTTNLPSSPEPATTPLSELQAQKLLANINGALVSVALGEELLVPRNKVFIIKGIQSNISKLDNEIQINVKGFAPPKLKNDGNDINFPIYPEQDLWVRYSEHKKGVRYPIDATYKEKVIGQFWVRLVD